MAGGRRRKVRTAVAAGLAVLVAGVVVAATNADGRRSATSGQSGRGRTEAGVVAAPDMSSAGGKAPSDGLASAPPLPGAPARTVDPAGPRIVRTGELSVRVGKGRFAGAFDRVSAIAAVNGGFVVSSSTVTQRDDNRSVGARAVAGDLVIRVAADRFDAARRALAELGAVERESLRGEDVGGQLVDYEARLRSLGAQEEALRILLTKAGGVAEVIQVQNALFEVRQQSEQLQAQRDQLSQAAFLSTLQVSLFEPGAAPTIEPVREDGLARSVERAADGAVAVIGGTIVVVGWLLPLAVLGLLAWGANRLRRRMQAPAPRTATPAAP